MKWLAVITLLTSSISAIGQEVNHKPFRLAIILPDTMIVSDQLKRYAGQIESDHLNDYYAAVKGMESRLQSFTLSDSLTRFPLTKRKMKDQRQKK